MRKKIESAREFTRKRLLLAFGFEASIYNTRSTKSGKVHGKSCRLPGNLPNRTGTLIRFT
jgi:hypothetical protein